MKKILFLVLGLWGIFNSSNANPTDIPARTEYSYLPKSPEVEAFLRYFDIPVDYSRGVHNVSIPIYTIEGNNIQLPITLSYHASGIKVRDVATSVGLGWTLNAGGSILQMVQGNMDSSWLGFESAEEVIQSIETIKAQIGPNPSGTLLYGAVPNIERIRKGEIDMAADKYNFSFNGHSGIFYSGIAEGSPAEFYTVPSSSLKIEELGTSGFRITTDKGEKYVFGHREATTIIGSRPRAARWVLEEIISANNLDTLRIEYDESYLHHEYGLTSYKRTGIFPLWKFDFNNFYIVDESSTNIVSVDHIDERPRTTERIHLPTKITLNDVEVSIHYDDNRSDLNSYNQGKRLSRVEVRKGRTVIKTVSFEHAFIDNEPWTKMISNQPKTLANKRMFLDRVKFTSTDSAHPPLVYKLSYNHDIRLPANFDHDFSISPRDYNYPEDYWGYYNGKTNPHLMPASGANLNYDENYIQAGILKQITYPSGGHTGFTYEANGEGGGVRIRKIEHLTAEGVAETKEYAYSRKRYENIEHNPIGFFVDEDVQVIFHVDPSIGRYHPPSKTYVSYIKCEYSPSQYAYNRGYSFYYSEVTEYNGSLSDHDGYTLYSYLRKFPDDVNRSYYYAMENLYGDFSMDYPEDLVFLGINEPVLVSKKSFKTEPGGTTLQEEISYDYEFVGSCVLRPLGVKWKFTNSYSPSLEETSYVPGLPGDLSTFDEEYFGHIYVGSLRAYLPPLKMVGETVKSYAGNHVVTKETQYTYDTAYYNVKEIRTTNSNSDQIVQRLKYPQDMTGTLYTKMKNAHMTSLPVSSERYVNNCLATKTENVYSDQFTGGQIRVNRVNITNSGFPAYEEVRINAYNKRGNPTHITRGGNDVIYIWGYGGTQVIAEIRNCTLSRLQTALSAYGVTLDYLESLTYPGQQTISNILNYLRDNLDGALMDSYLYSAFGITEHKDASERSSTYTYDGFGRLISIKDEDGNILEHYQYNYKN